MKTKNIIRTLLMAAFLLAGANNVKADDIWTTAQYGGSISLTKDMLKDAKKGTKLQFYIGQKDDNYWQIDFKINDSVNPDFKNFPDAGKWGNTWALQTRNDLITDGHLDIVFGDNTADRINSHGSLTVNLTNVEVTKIILVNEAAVKHTVTFMANNEVFSTIEVEDGDPIPMPATYPSKGGNVFVGWEGLPDVMPNEDITVTATFREGVEESAWSEGGYSLDWDFGNKGISIDADLFNRTSGDVYVRVYGVGGGGWQVQLGYVENGQGKKINVDGNNEGIISVYSSAEKKATMAYGYVEYKIDATSLAVFKANGAKVGGTDFVASKVTVVANSFGNAPISKTDVTLTYSATTASATTASIGQPLADAPTLAVSPEGLDGITYSSSNTDVATVAADGKVTIAGAGTTTITATFIETDTHKGATASYTLTVSKQNVTMSFSQETASAKMEQTFTPPTLTVSPEGLEGVTYSSSNTGVATVSNNGSVTLVSAGTTTITASFAETAVYYSASASYSLTVAEADVPTFTVTVSEPANGQISVSPITDVTAGTTVTITATPSDGYKLATITVTSADETNIELNGTGNTRTFVMPSQNVTVSATFAEIETVEAIVTSTTGFATFCSDKALDFTGISTIEAYYAKTVENGNVYLLRVYGTVKAGTGLVLKGTTTRIPVAESGDELEGNMLIGVSADTDVNASTDYVLTEKNGVAVFAQTGVNKATVAAGHAYLRVSVAQARTRTIGIGGEGTTGIENTFIDDCEQGEKVIYNLSGQRVKNPTKGLYIINGKKMIIE